VTAVFEKELRYLSRSGPMLFTLVVPLFMLVVFRSSGHNQDLFAHAPELTFPLGAAYSLLLLTNLLTTILELMAAVCSFFSPRRCASAKS